MHHCVYSSQKVPRITRWVRCFAPVQNIIAQYMHMCESLETVQYVQDSMYLRGACERARYEDSCVGAYGQQPHRRTAVPINIPVSLCSFLPIHPSLTASLVSLVTLLRRPSYPARRALFPAKVLQGNIWAIW